MYEHEPLPRARQDGLLEEAIAEELLLYDQSNHTAHCLSPIAACVWRHCDGERNIAELAQLTGGSEDLVAYVLHELREKHLLDAGPALMQSTISGESRREAIGRVARYGAAAAVGSMVVSATAATPAMASSGEEESAGAKCVTGTTTCCICTGGATGYSGLTSQTVCEGTGRCGANNVEFWNPVDSRCSGKGCKI